MQIESERCVGITPFFRKSRKQFSGVADKQRTVANKQPTITYRAVNLRPLFKAMIMQYLLEAHVHKRMVSGLVNINNAWDQNVLIRVLLTKGLQLQSCFYRLRRYYLTNADRKTKKNIARSVRVIEKQNVQVKSNGKIDFYELVKSSRQLAGAGDGECTAFKSLLNLIENKVGAKSNRTSLMRQQPTKKSIKDAQEHQEEGQVYRESCYSRESCDSSESLAQKSPQYRSSKFLKHHRLEVAKIGLLCLCSSLKSKTLRLQMDALIGMKLYSSSVQMTSQQERNLVQRSLQLLEQNFEKDEQIIELHQQLQQKQLQIELMEEEVTYFKRLAKFGVFDRLQQQTIRTMAEVFNKLMYAKSFVFIQRTDESVSLISQETPISVLEELAADDNREEMVKVKTLIYIEDEKTSDMSESLDIDYDNCPLNSFKKLVARCNEIIFESPNARSRVDLFKTQSEEPDLFSRPL